MIPVVQFSTMQDFINDIDMSTSVYYDLVDQLVETGVGGLTRWRLATIIRALVYGHDGRSVRVAMLTIPHPSSAAVMANGQVIGPVGMVKGAEGGRWNQAEERHDLIIRSLKRLMDEAHGEYITDRLRPGVLNVPNDLALVYAENPVVEPEAVAS